LTVHVFAFSPYPGLHPLKHLDPLGVLFFFVMKIGWAKPVPVNPANLANPHRDLFWISLAGPGANAALAIVSALLVKVLLAASALLPPFLSQPLLAMGLASVWINLLLAVFNLLPIPPLDGSKILLGLLPSKWALAYLRLQPFGFIVLLVMFYSGIAGKIILPIIHSAEKLLLR